MISRDKKLKALQYILMIMRRRYTALVADGEMRQEDAQEKIRILQSIVEDYGK